MREQYNPNNYGLHLRHVIVSGIDETDLNESNVPDDFLSTFDVSFHKREEDREGTIWIYSASLQVHQPIPIPNHSLVRFGYGIRDIPEDYDLIEKVLREKLKEFDLRNYRRNLLTSSTSQFTDFSLGERLKQEDLRKLLSFIDGTFDSYERAEASYEIDVDVFGDHPNFSRHKIVMDRTYGERK